jgi:hypothetical protein
LSQFGLPESSGIWRERQLVFFLADVAGRECCEWNSASSLSFPRRNDRLLVALVLPPADTVGWDETAEKVVFRLHEPEALAEFFRSFEVQKIG